MEAQMRSWIFYPQQTTNESFNDSIELLFGGGTRYPARDEFRELMPECRRTVQQPSLGFFCGTLPGDPVRYPSLREGIPDYPRREYQADFLPTVQIWQTKLSFCAAPVPERSFLWTAKAFSANCISVDGEYPPGPPDIWVFGCRSFLFSPYILK